MSTFIEINVIDFQEITLPYTTVTINTNFLVHMEPIAPKHRQSFKKQREMSIERNKKDPDVFVTAFEELPEVGCVLMMQTAGILYATTPYNEIKKLIKEASNDYWKTN